MRERPPVFSTDQRRLTQAGPQRAGSGPPRPGDQSAWQRPAGLPAILDFRAFQAQFARPLLQRTAAGPGQASQTPAPLAPPAYQPYIEFINHARNVAYVVSQPGVAGLSSTRENNLFREWREGYGPAYRLFLDEHPMTGAMQAAYGVQQARRLFYNKYKNEWLKGHNIDKGTVGNFRAGFGPLDLVRAGANLTEQFVGNYRVDIFTIEGGRHLLFRVADSKSRNSFYYHIQGAMGRFTPARLRDRERAPDAPTPESNTYQLYMWKERNIYHLDRL